jgi:CheY-like chemotaxis protein
MQLSNGSPLPAKQEEGTRLKPYALTKTTEEIKNYKILHIEDLEANIDLVKQIFARRKDIEILFALNAEEGIKLAQAEIPDLILMDIHLPEMDGITAFKKLQEIDEVKNIPVLALTADARDEKIKRHTLPSPLLCPNLQIW